jgi:hypothetical protein
MEHSFHVCPTTWKLALKLSAYGPSERSSAFWLPQHHSPWHTGLSMWQSEGSMAPTCRRSVQLATTLYSNTKVGPSGAGPWVFSVNTLSMSWLP